MASADRWIGSRQRWSGRRARPSQERQKWTVASRRFSASSTSAGDLRPSAQESEQKRRSPASSACRARTRSPSIPMAMLDCSRIVTPAPLASAAWRPPSTMRPLRGDAAVVEDRLADELDLDRAREALNGANEHVVGVVVGRRPRVRRDLVLVVPRPHGQGVSDDDPAGRRLPGRGEDVRPGLVHDRRRMVDAEGPEPKRAGPPVEQAAEHARRVERGNAEPVDGPVGRDERAGVAVGQERVVGDGRERRRRRCALPGGFLLGLAHGVTQGPYQRPWPAVSSAVAVGPHEPGAYGCTGGGASSSGCMIRHVSSTPSWRVKRVL